MPPAWFLHLANILAGLLDEAAAWQTFRAGLGICPTTPQWNSVDRFVSDDTVNVRNNLPRQGGKSRHTRSLP